MGFEIDDRGGEVEYVLIWFVVKLWLWYFVYILYGIREWEDNEGLFVYIDSYNNYFGNGLYFYSKYLSMKIKE